MVNKIAVIALVAIVACPILLGYGMNFQNVAETVYTPDQNSVNVTQLLEDSTAYQYITADPYTMNAQVFSQNQYPLYSTTGSINTSLYMKQYFYQTGETPSPYDPRDVEWYHLEYSNTAGFDITITGTGGNLVPIAQVTDVYYLKDGDNLYITHHNGTVNNYHGVIYVSYAALPAGSATVHYALTAWDTYEKVSQANAFINLIGGYKFNNSIQYNLPSLTNKMVMSLDLYTGVNGSFGLTFGTPAELGINFTKQSGYWSVKVNNGSGPLTEIFQLPINNSSNSVYQMTITNKELRFDYIGGWYMPSFGIANSYATWSYDIDIHDFQYITYHPENPTTVSPTLRMDLVMVRAMDYNIIEDKNYDPSKYQPNNPATTINKIQQYGSSISFGGHTYAVSKKSISIGTHQLSLEGMVFDSVPNGGSYDNRINGTVISTTASPSTITFSGKWLMNVSTDSQSSTTTYHQKWIAGSFAWDGMDTNFLIVGLITSLGVFIALGIYGRKSGAKVWPLMIVCGGAAALFFCLL